MLLLLLRLLLLMLLLRPRHRSSLWAHRSELRGAGHSERHRTAGLSTHLRQLLLLCLSLSLLLLWRLLGRT